LSHNLSLSHGGVIVAEGWSDKIYSYNLKVLRILLLLNFAKRSLSIFRGVVYESVHTFVLSEMVRIIDERKKSWSLWWLVKLHACTHRKYYRHVKLAVLGMIGLICLVRMYRYGYVDKATLNLGLPLATDSTTHYCLLNQPSTGKMFRSSVHFPFVVEWVAECWHWLENSQKLDEGAIVLDDTIYDRFLVHPNFPNWNQPFFQALGLPIVNSHQPLNLRDKKIHTGKFGSRRWFTDPKSCSSMRSLLWEKFTNPSNATTAPSSKIHIGFVERPARRLIVNSSGLAKGLQQAYPDSVVSYRIFTGKDSMQDQSTWYKQQHIVIAAHGAASTNAIFMRPKSHFLELFPHNFFSVMYQPLAEQCGVVYDYYYDGGPNPEQDCNNHYADRGTLRNRNIIVNWQDLKQKVNGMMTKLKNDGPERIA
jgi:hypothetical protein